VKIRTIGERMKYQVFAVAGAVVIANLAHAPAANAQSQRGGSGSVQSPASRQAIDRRVAMLTSHLQLYSGQVTKIRGILAQEREQITTLKNSPTDSRLDRSGPGPRSSSSVPLPEVRTIMDRTEREIEKVLSARQLAAYRALKEGKKLPNYLQQTRWAGFAA
jgi:hypothetical protein